MRCHECRAEVPVTPGTTIGFRDECDECRADLHVCLNCRHHDESASNECREPGAEPVRDRDRANRCDWFQPRERSAPGGDTARSAARSDLERLFGDD